LFKKILVANRGEIAVRIIRACKELNIKTVAIHSNVDTEAMHVKLADESICVGSALPNESYLNIPSIISAIDITGADAVHPGYGFLSENDKFAKILSSHKVKFIGPTSKSILELGNKSNALKLASDFKLPILGNKNSKNIDNTSDAQKISKEIGMPVVIKAAYGGGGKGMRVFKNSSEIDKFFSQLKAEAKNYFGDDTMYAEKFLTNAKHIEFQVISDPKNNYAEIIGQRDCSIQRKNQKIIEEIPSEFVDINNLNIIEKSIKDLLLKNKYEGLGTLEFLYQDNEIFFIEMNTRLQVEHPVTEEAFDIDLVKYQIMVAAGYKIDLSNVIRKNHTIECRINAENAKDFSPSPGTVKFINVPGGRGVRIDTALYTNYKVNPHYDSLILKIVSKGKDRNESISIMKRALDEIIIDGINTNIELHKWILNQNDFINGIYNTNWLEKNISKFN
jgi:acetyl-CoA carboxylase biotin carboxylase subunit